jgi:hypothetical protein
MSTKIYTGFRLTARTMREALDSLAIVSVRCAKILDARQASFIANTSVEFIDKAVLADQPGYSASEVSKSPMVSAWMKLMERQDNVRRTQCRDPVVDFEVIFRLWLCRSTNAFIGYVIGEGAGHFLQELLASRRATEYGYWNNTDRPDTLNDRQWKKRGDIWYALLNGDSGPWFDVRVPVPNTFGQLPEVLAAVPALDKRVRRHAEALALNDWFNAEKAANPELDALAAYREFRMRRRDSDPTVTRHIEKATALVTTRLAPTITEAMLCGS